MKTPAAPSATEPTSAVSKPEKPPEPPPAIDLKKATRLKTPYVHEKTGMTAAYHFSGHAYTATGLPIAPHAPDHVDPEPAPAPPNPLSVTKAHRPATEKK